DRGRIVRRRPAVDSTRRRILERGAIVGLEDGPSRVALALARPAGVERQQIERGARREIPTEASVSATATAARPPPSATCARRSTKKAGARVAPERRPASAAVGGLEVELHAEFQHARR